MGRKTSSGKKRKYKRTKRCKTGICEVCHKNCRFNDRYEGEIEEVAEEESDGSDY